MGQEILGYLTELKKEFNKIYGLIIMKNFIYFLCEVEFELLLKKWVMKKK